MTRDADVLPLRHVGPVASQTNVTGCHGSTFCSQRISERLGVTPRHDFWHAFCEFPRVPRAQGREHPGLASTITTSSGAGVASAHRTMEEVRVGTLRVRHLTESEVCRIVRADPGTTYCSAEAPDADGYQHVEIRSDTMEARLHCELSLMRAQTNALVERCVQGATTSSGADVASAHRTMDEVHVVMLRVRHLTESEVQRILWEDPGTTYCSVEAPDADGCQQVEIRPDTMKTCLHCEFSLMRAETNALAGRVKEARVRSLARDLDIRDDREAEGDQLVGETDRLGGDRDRGDDGSDRGG